MRSLFFSMYALLRQYLLVRSQKFNIRTCSLTQPHANNHVTFKRPVPVYWEFYGWLNEIKPDVACTAFKTHRYEKTLQRSWPKGVGRLASHHLGNEVTSVVTGRNDLNTKVSLHILQREVVKEQVVVTDH